RDLLGSARRGDAGGGEPGARDRQRGPGAAPVELFGRDHLHLALGVGGRALDRLERPEALPAGLADDLPGDALILDVLASRRPDHVAGEAPATLLELQLLLVQFEIHRSPTRSARVLIDWSVNDPKRLADRPASPDGAAASSLL